MISFIHRILSEAEATTAERFALRQEIMDILFIDYPQACDSPVLNEVFDKVNTDLLRMFADRLRTGTPVERFGWLYFANAATSQYPVLCYKALTTIPGFAGCFDAEEAANGLGQYWHLEDTINGVNGEKVALSLMEAALRLASDSEVSSLVTTATIYNGEDVLRHGYHIEDDRLSKLIADHPDRVDDIVNAIIHRGGYTDAASIWEAANTPALVLSEGAL